MLIPMQIVREEPPGSGNFQPIQDNGLSANATLPIYATESGAGLAETLTENSLDITLASNIGSSSISTLTITLNAGSGYTGTLTETAAGSGIFSSSDSTVTATLIPPTQITSDSTIDTLNVLISDTALGLGNQAFTLQETSATSKSFTTSLNTVDVQLTGPLSTSVVNIITVYLITGDIPITYSLTETGVNTRIFKDTTGTSIAITNYNGTVGGSMNVAVTGSFLSSKTYITTLNETSATSFEHSNVQSISGDAQVSTPDTDGEGVFYIQMSGATSTTISLSSANDPTDVVAAPVPGQPGVLRTGKLALVAAGDPFKSLAITTIRMTGNSDKLGIAVLGQQVAQVPSALPAYVCGFDNGDSRFHLPIILPEIQTLLKGGGHWNATDAVSSQLVGEQSNGLGWDSSPPDMKVTKADILSALPTHSLFFFSGHGLTPSGEAPPFDGFAVAKSHDAGQGFDIFAPGDIQLPASSLSYRLVFLDCCFSGDRTSTVPIAMKSAFNALTYVGWEGEEQGFGCYNYGQYFISQLSKESLGPVQGEINQDIFELKKAGYKHSTLRIIGDKTSKGLNLLQH